MRISKDFFDNIMATCDYPVDPKDKITYTKLNVRSVDLWVFSFSSTSPVRHFKVHRTIYRKVRSCSFNLCWLKVRPQAHELYARIGKHIVFLLYPDVVLKSFTPQTHQPAIERNADQSSQIATLLSLHQFVKTSLPSCPHQSV